MAKATFGLICDAGRVRLGEMALALLDLEERFLPTVAVEEAMFDLGAGLEEAAKCPPGDEQDRILSHLNETYGLVLVPTDPLLRASMPPVPATGAAPVIRVLAVNGKVVVANNAFIGLGAYLVPTETV